VQQRDVPVKRSEMAAGTVRLAFEMRGVKPAQEVNPAVPDVRRLGVAVVKMAITKPAS